MAIGPVMLRTSRVFRIAALTKWAIFGVLLPLLPVAGHVAAAVWAGDVSELSFSSIFGDGELLVLATVVAAAAFGDLVFESRAAASSGERAYLKIGFVSALSLFVVVLSVLFFGLVSYQNELRRTALARAQTDQVQQVRQVVAYEHGVATRAAEVATINSRIQTLNRQIATLQRKAQNEIHGTGGSGVAGVGALAKALLSEVTYLEQARTRALADLNSLRASIASLDTSAESRVSSAATSVNHALERAAVVSIVMFALALLIGASAIRVLTNAPIEMLSELSLLGPGSSTSFDHNGGGPPAPPLPLDSSVEGSQPGGPESPTVPAEGAET